MATREVGKTYVFSYADIKWDEDGWANAKQFRPKPYDLVYLKVEREGETKKKALPGWWTGTSWDGRPLREDDRVLSWKYKEPKDE